MEDAILVFTGRSPEQMYSERGSQAWRLSQVRASRCLYLVCTQNNRFHPRIREGRAPHRAAFLVAKISGIAPLSNNPGRCNILFNEYQLIDHRDHQEIWPKLRFPVHYTNIADLNITITPLWSKI